MKKVLITGCCGFIGSHLCDYFLEKENIVFGIDNLITGNINNIQHHRKNNKFIFLESDVSSKIKIKDKIDLILHFSSPASPVDYMNFSIETLKTGSIGTINILEFARAHNSKLIFASTSEVYGDPKVHPQNESYYGNVNPIGPRSMYDESKRFSEALIIAYQNRYNIDTRIVRLFNTYGPRMKANDGRVIPNFINQSILNKNFTVFGNGMQTRSFCYIDDTINALSQIISVNYNYPINLGNPQEINMLQLIELIKKINPSKSEVEFYPSQMNDPIRRKPDISLLRKLTGWNPETNLYDGLKKTFNYFFNELV